MKLPDHFPFGWFACCVLLLSTLGCKQNLKNTDLEEIRVRFSSEPDILNPILARRPLSAQLGALIFASPATYDKSGHQLVPYLLEERPTITEDKFYLKFKDGIMFDSLIQFHASDYLFTYKLYLLPYILNGRSHPQLNTITEIQLIDSLNISIGLERLQIQSEEALTALELLPEYYYDKEGFLRHFSFSDLNQYQLGRDSLLDKALDSFFNVFQNNIIHFTNPKGAGPYELVNWQRDNHIILKTKDHWWGKSSTIPDFLKPKHAKLHIEFIKEDQTTIASLRQNILDVAADLSIQNIEDSSGFEKIFYDTPQQYYMSVNNQRIDKDLRLAMANAMNKQSYIDKLFNGRAIVSTGPFHPSKSYYKKVTPPKSHIQNFPDRTLELLTTTSPLSASMAQLIQNDFGALNIKLEIVPLSVGELITRCRNLDYDLALLSLTNPIGNDFPYNTWHSSAVLNANNLSGFTNTTSDSLLEELQFTVVPEKQKQIYYEFQDLLAEEMPAIFICSPQKYLITNENTEITLANNGFGFYLNSINLSHASEIVH